MVPKGFWAPHCGFGKSVDEFPSEPSNTRCFCCPLLKMIRTKNNKRAKNSEGKHGDRHPDSPGYVEPLGLSRSHVAACQKVLSALPALPKAPGGSIQQIFSQISKWNLRNRFTNPRELNPKPGNICGPQIFGQVGVVSELGFLTP